jgi:hypothetical protein
MKKLIILFFITYIFSYANYLITNSEIVLFYDKDYNSVQYIRGDIFNNIDISKIEGKLILDEREIISINKYFTGAELLTQNNIFRLHYSIDGKEMCVDIIPSMYERDKLYFVVEFINFLPDNRKVDFAFKIVPQHENRYLDFNENSLSYSYDNFYFRAENYSGELYISRDSTIEEFRLEEVREKTKKYQDDSLYYIVKDIDYKKPINFAIKFYQDFNKNSNYNGEYILERETEYWTENGYRNEFEDKKKIFIKELNNLDIMTSRLVIPNRIGYNKSKESLNNKIKLYYLNTLYDKDFNFNKLFEDINIRKSENEAVVYYNFLFKYLNDSGKYLTGELLERKIIPEVLSLLDYLEEIDDEVINVRNNINNYYWYYEMITNIEDRREFENYKDFISEKKTFLLNYLNENYVLDDGLKIRKESEQSFYKTIKYIGFLPKEKQLSILMKDYKKYYNRDYGVLKRVESDNRIDLDYNLNFIIKLYENGESRLADILFANIKTYIRKNQFYVTTYIYPDRNNMPGIDGEILYLYFMAEESRKKYGD